MSSSPWDDWIPGVLSNRQIDELVNHGLIHAPSQDKIEIGPSSMDLTLSGKGYEMVGGSVKPGGGINYEHLILNLGLARVMHPDKDGNFILKCRQTYVFRLREKIQPTVFSDANIHGQATAKSSIGRVDVLARLIVVGMNQYECFSPEKLRRVHADGTMFLEITPMTFDVAVREGVSLSQLRLFYGSPEKVIIDSEELFKTALHGGPGENYGSLSVDLTPTSKGGLDASVLLAEREANRPPIPLWGSKQCDPCDYWMFRRCDDHERIKISREAFYIIRSKEKISLPKGVAVYCRATDETIGEMRIHYAGFVHPWFGWGNPTPLIFEVRGHDVDVSLADEETMAKLIFYRMSDDADKPDDETYQGQGLTLSKFFKDWPEGLEFDDSSKGTVKPRPAGGE